MILANDLSKFFGSFAAVKALNFSIGKGEIIGFIGPNGAGKTTTMRMLTGYLPASKGKVEIDGHDVFSQPMRVKRIVGYLPETPPLYPALTIGNYLDFVAEIREVPHKGRRLRVAQVMDQVGLNGWERRTIRSLSKGYRQRVGLAQAILHDPKVLILDEPTSGLDPAQVVGIRNFISQLAETKTVILSTHILSEVELICNRAILINNGEIMVDGDLDSIREKAGGIRFRIGIRGEAQDLPVQLAALSMVTQVKLLEEDEGVIRLDIYATEDPRDEIASLASLKNWKLREMEKVIPSLEEAFLAVVGEE
jgi:ABC-2 type transport system ATP-binding protein